MFLIPFQINEQEYSLFIGLQNENWERIREYDPAEVRLREVVRQKPLFGSLRLRDVIVGYVTDEDINVAMGKFLAGKPQEAMRFLTRGFRYRPEAGDHDGPYLSVGTEGESKQ